MTTGVTTQPVQANSCWTSFTNGCSSALRQLANGVSKVWTAIKSAANTVYNAVAPYAAKAVAWARLNSAAAAAIGVGGAIATAVSVYFCCYRNAAPATPPAPPVVPQATA